MPILAAPDVAQLLRELGQRTALRGGNPYPAKAYTRAAENLSALPEPLEELVAQDRLVRRRGAGQCHLHRAAKLLESAKQQLRRSKLQVKQILPAGDFRRGCELVADLAVVVETSKLEGEPRKLISNSQLSVWGTRQRAA